MSIAKISISMKGSKTPSRGYLLLKDNIPQMALFADVEIGDTHLKLPFVQFFESNGLQATLVALQVEENQYFYELYHITTKQLYGFNQFSLTNVVDAQDIIYLKMLELPFESPSLESMLTLFIIRFYGDMLT